MVPEIGAALLASARDYRKYRSRPGWFARGLGIYARLRHLFWSVLSSSDIDPQAKIGERTRLPHPNGIVIHAEAIVGDDCLIMQQVTIGQIEDSHVPLVGSGVYIGAGAKLLGKIVVGDRARIGANAVVICDVPADWTAVGIPARLIPPDFKSDP